MNTMERFDRMMASLDPERRAGLLLAARRLLEKLQRREDDKSEDQEEDATGRILHAFDRVMDWIEADAHLAVEVGDAAQDEGQKFDAEKVPDRLLNELELWVEANRRLRPRKLPPGRVRCKTVNRLQELMPRLGGFEQDSLVDAASRLPRSWRSGWSEMESWQRTVGVWRILCALNEQMGAMERGMKELLEFEAAEERAGGAVTSEMAVEIATRERNVDPAGLPDGWTTATKVTDEPCTGLYQTWGNEPAWYVWFPPRFFGLGSSEVLVVSKRTGKVIGGGSACDEG